MENGREKRIEQRTRTDLASVEFAVSALDLPYQFKVRETSISGLSILVREDSAILEHLEEGMIIEMKYYLTDRSEKPQLIKTKIMHITKGHSRSLEGHCFVGLQLQ